MKIIANNYEAKDILKIIRQWTELTQNEYAKTLNKSKANIQSYELGRNKISLNQLLEIAKIHNLIITIEKR